MNQGDFSVSVIIPVYNASRYVRDSVASVLQLPEVKEVLLVEDGSQDNSLQVCMELTALDSRVKVYRHEHGVNKGAGASRNVGVQKAAYPFISFLDSDDCYFQNRYTEAKKIFKDQAGVDGVFEMVLMVNEGNQKEKLFGVHEELDSKELFRYILRGGYFHTNAITVRRDFILSLGPFKQECWPHEDVEMWLRMAYSGTLVSGNRRSPVATYRIHSVNLGTHAFSNVSRAKLWKTIFDNFFSKNIGFVNRIIILKQMLRFRLARLFS